jgi:hypothetical protein
MSPLSESMKASGVPTLETIFRGDINGRVVKMVKISNIGGEKGKFFVGFLQKEEVGNCFWSQRTGRTYFI